jgi:hypothetical protein
MIRFAIVVVIAYLLFLSWACVKLADRVQALEAQQCSAQEQK